MYNIYENHYYPPGDCPDPHFITGASSQGCAWREGWATFFALAANDNPYYTYPEGSLEDLEMPTGIWDNGDEVEGRVAGALWDIFDNHDDDYDEYGHSFDEIWYTIYTHNHDTFADYWQDWKDDTSGSRNRHEAVKSVYQNTIDYNDTPTIENLPDRSLYQGNTWNNSIDLWDDAYTQDDESSKYQLSFVIDNTPNPYAGVSIDSNRYIDINPDPTWYGTTDVRIKVNDEIATDTDTFTVTVTQTVPPSLPTVVCSAASYITSSSARLNGAVTDTGGENPTVHIYWGLSDGGTNPGSWDHDVNLGALGAGAFYTDISSLDPGTTCYYRCYAVNSVGPDWADSTETFETALSPPALISPEDGAYVEGTSVAFQWNAVDGASRYWLRVDNITDGCNKFREDLGNVTQYTDSGYLDDGDVYEWKVWAGNEDGWGDVSEIWSFTNDSM